MPLRWFLSTAFLKSNVIAGSIVVILSLQYICVTGILECRGRKGAHSALTNKKAVAGAPQPQKHKGQRPNNGLQAHYEKVTYQLLV
jgi:hypothetical protein